MMAGAVNPRHSTSCFVYCPVVEVILIFFLSVVYCPVVEVILIFFPLFCGGVGGY